MKNTISFILTFFFVLSSCAQVVRLNADRQKVTTFELQGPVLQFQIENDILRTVDLSALLDSVSGGTDDQTAAEVTIADAGSIITGVNVETALQENRTAIDLNTAKVTNTDDQDASEVAFSPNGSIAATNVQAAIQEVRDEAVGGSAPTGYHSNNAITADATAAYSNQVNGNGHRVVNLLTGTNDIDITIESIRAEANENYAFKSISATAQVDFLKGTDARFFLNSELVTDEIRLDGIGNADIFEYAQNDFYFTGNNLVEFSITPPAFSPNNFADLPSYTNADNRGTLGTEDTWITFQGSAISVIESGETGGSTGGSTYALRAQKTTTGNGLFTGIRYDMSSLGLVSGTSYDVIIDIKYVTAPSASAVLQCTFTGASSGGSTNFGSTGGQSTYTTFTRTFVAGASMTWLDITLGTANTDTIPVDVYLKNLQIIETP